MNNTPLTVADRASIRLADARAEAARLATGAEQSAAKVAVAVAAEAAQKDALTVAKSKADPTVDLAPFRIEVDRAGIRLADARAEAEGAALAAESAAAAVADAETAHAAAKSAVSKSTESR